MTSVQPQLSAEPETCERLAFSYNYSGTYRLAYNACLLGLKCRSLSPVQRATFFLYAAIALNHLGQPQSAGKFCDEGIKVCPPNNHRLQVLLISQSQWAASARIKQLLDPTAPTPLEYPNACALVAGNYYALSLYQQVYDISMAGLQSTPLDSGLKALFCLYAAIALNKLGLPAEALQFAQQGIEASPHDMTALANLKATIDTSRRNVQCHPSANTTLPLLHRVQNWNP